MDSANPGAATPPGLGDGKRPAWSDAEVEKGPLELALSGHFYSAMLLCLSPGGRPWGWNPDLFEGCDDTVLPVLQMTQTGFSRHYWNELLLLPRHPGWSDGDENRKPKQKQSCLGTLAQQ